MLNDPIANALSKISRYDQLGKRECIISPSNSLMRGMLRILNEEGYCGSTEDMPEERKGTLRVNLLGNINKACVIKPRFAVKWDDFEKFEKRYLPAKALGVLIVSTSEGLLTHALAKEKKIGGKLIAYCY